MSSLLAIFALCVLTAAPVARAAPVRIGLFSLFKPEAIQLRISPGGGAALDAGGLSGSVALASGDSVRIGLLGNRLSIAVSDSYGRVKRTWAAEKARVVPNDSTMFELSIPGKIKRVVRGGLEVTPREHHPMLRIVLETSGESAVASVVAAELSGEREAESFKALAVVVRTFMLSHRGRHADEGFDFCDTTHCQLYRGEQDLAAEAASPFAARAVAETEGEYLSFQGRPIESYYTAVCGGLSATPEMVWGNATASGYPHRQIVCHWCERARFSRWERAARRAMVFDALSRFRGSSFSQAAELVVESDTGGFVRSVVVREGNRLTRFTTDAFRRAIGLRLGWNTVLSPTFTIRRRGDSLIFRGRGFGSQVGLCEAGAVAQAAAGRAYREILSFYYPRAEIKTD